MMYLNILQDIGNAIDGIFDFLEGIFNFVDDVAHFILDFFKDLYNALDYLWKAKSILIDFMNSLPNWLFAFAIATVSILILYKIIGRSGGAN